MLPLHLSNNYMLLHAAGTHTHTCCHCTYRTITCSCTQLALKFEHRSSKGCNYGTPYEWSVYK